MKLAHHTRGRGPCVSFVHGFTQTAQSWSNVATSLPNYSCTLIDAPGHGDTLDGSRSLTQCGDDIAETMEPGVLVGYSMGARMALHTALQHPGSVHRLVLVSGTAGIEDQAERAKRIASDNALADHIEAVGVSTFIPEWLANPMFAGLSTQDAQIDERLRNTATGLADSLRYAGTGTQTPLWNRLHELKMPVLLIVGSNDKKFTALAERMQSLISGSRTCVIPHAGHTVHLENHTSFVRELSEFLL